MAFTKRRHYNKNPQRRKIPGVGSEEKRPRRTPIVPETVGPNSTSNVPIEFDGPCFLVETHVPLLKCGAFLCSGAVQNTPTNITFQFSGLGPFTGDITIPFEDPSVRNIVGGFMQPGVYPQAAP